MRPHVIWSWAICFDPFDISLDGFLTVTTTLSFYYVSYHMDNFNSAYFVVFGLVHIWKVLSIGLQLDQSTNQHLTFVTFAV